MYVSFDVQMFSSFFGVHSLGGQDDHVGTFCEEVSEQDLADFDVEILFLAGEELAAGLLEFEDLFETLLTDVMVQAIS